MDARPVRPVDGSIKQMQKRLEGPGVHFFQKNRLTDLPDGALEDMKRYVSYAWPPGRIAQLLNRAYDLNLTRETVIGMLRRLKHECE